MMDKISTVLTTPAKQLYRISIAAVIITLFFSGQDMYADKLNDCMMEALTHADDSVTVGQLRQQCRQEDRTDSLAPNSRDISEAIEHDIPDTTLTEKNGPAEIVLKTAQAKKPAYLPHKRHQDKYTCETCHHDKNSSGKKIRYGAGTITFKCTACHNPDMPNMELNNFKLVGHELCRECHRKNQDITSAKCSTCHRKGL